MRFQLDKSSKIILIIAILLFCTQSAIATELSVISWNVESGDSKDSYVEGFIKENEGIDLWGLSEVPDKNSAKKYLAAANSPADASYQMVFGTTGGSDRLVILYNADKLKYIKHAELHHINLQRKVRSPFVATFEIKDSGFRFLFMVNHLYRGKKLSRHNQAKLLNAWGAKQKLPVIAVGDYNFDWDVKKGFKKHDKGYDYLVKDQVFRWVKPEKIIPTHCHDTYKSVLDFIFVSNTDKLVGISRIMKEKASYCPDDVEKSDHRPVYAVFKKDPTDLPSYVNVYRTEAAGRDAQISAITSMRVEDVLSNQFTTIAPNTGVYTQSDDVRPVLSWEMARRYGLDNNNNSIIDLPNSKTYVQNLDECPCNSTVEAECIPKYKVIFNATIFIPSILRDPPPLFGGGEHHGGTHPLPPYLQEKLDDLERNRRVGHSNLRMRQLSFKLKIEGSNLPNPIELTKKSASLEFPVCLPEGDYIATLQGFDGFAKEWNEASFPVKVKDILIVNMGNSFASGEGNPEESVYWKVDRIFMDDPPEYIKAEARKFELLDAEPLWADDGKPYEYKTVNKNFYILPAFGSPGPIVRVKCKRKVPRWSQFSSIHKDHYKSHRSSIAASSQLALMLENADPKTSVTYLNLAMSGATIDTVRTGTDGVENARFYQYNIKMRSQTGQLARKVHPKQTVDYLILSIGGNDVGFANIIEALVGRNRSTFAGQPIVLGPKYSQILSGIKTGTWAQIDKSLPSPYDDVYNWGDKAGLNQLHTALSDLGDNLRTYNIANVFLLEYPVLYKKNANGDLCNEILNAYSEPIRIPVPGNPRLFNATIDFEIDKNELEWLEGRHSGGINLVGELNSRIRNFADQYGYTYIDGIRRMSYPHGMCRGSQFTGPYVPSYAKMDELLNMTNAQLRDTKRWFRRAKESAAIQEGSIKSSAGTAHPNEYAHRAIMSLLWEKVKHEVED